MNIIVAGSHQQRCRSLMLRDTLPIHSWGEYPMRKIENAGQLEVPISDFPRFGFTGNLREYAVANRVCGHLRILSRPLTATDLKRLTPKPDFIWPDSYGRRYPGSASRNAPSVMYNKPLLVLPKAPYSLLRCFCSP